MSDANSRAAFRLAPSLERALAGSAVRVGTENRAKLGAVRDALAPFSESPSALSIVPVGIASGVAEQPIGWGEIVAGARNRSRGALASGECVLAFGIEDGLVRLSEGSPAPDLRDYFNVGCAWVTDGEREGHGFSSGFAYPPGSLEPSVRGQAPIGDLFDELWRNRRRLPTAAGASPPPAALAPSGRGGGNIGLLTGGRLERAAYGSQAIVCALVRFLHTDLYD
ncbi:MAG: DUF84 family protein [bacterium]|nr:hypothetical protein [Deltaproteobacteria bacterium]MCP4904118.1 DUF84 family protein [bacterium]